MPDKGRLTKKSEQMMVFIRVNDNYLFKTLNFSLNTISGMASHQYVVPKLTCNSSVCVALPSLGNTTR